MRAHRQGPEAGASSTAAAHSWLPILAGRGLSRDAAGEVTRVAVRIRAGVCASSRDPRHPWPCKPLTLCTHMGSSQSPWKMYAMEKTIGPSMVT